MRFEKSLELLLVHCQGEFGHASSMKRRNTSPPAPEREELERQLEALQRDVRQLQFEHDLLKKANELLKKGPERRSATPE
jgi:hypothetical protein